MWGSRGVTTYQVDQIRVSFHRDWPVYGLPLVECETILDALRRGVTNTAIQKAECYLDFSVYDAKRRRPLLTGWGLDELDKALRTAAQYRQQHPREKATVPSANSVVGSSRWLAEAEKTNAEWEQEIDSFLRDFR